eukprot:SAG31_NODE_15572_length_748_cov_1.226502_1_plen_78_part_01
MTLDPEVAKMLPTAVGTRGRFWRGAEPAAEGGYAAVYIGMDRKTGMPRIVRLYLAREYVNWLGCCLQANRLLQKSWRK